MRLFRSSRVTGKTEAEGAAAGEVWDDSRSAASSTESHVAGERGISSVNRARSLQSRITNLFAAGLMLTLGAGLLGWYYAHAFARESQARRHAQAAVTRQAAGNMPLPPLGPITAPATSRRAHPSMLASALGPPPAPPPADVADAMPAGDPRGASVYGGAADTGSKSPWERALERKLSGPAFDTHSNGPSSAPGEGSPTALPGLETPVSNDGSAPPPEETPPDGRAASRLGALLRPTVTRSAHPSVLPTLHLLLPKGAFIDCTLETAIDSTLPGMTTCVTATDTFSADGTVVLLPRGTKLVGQTRGQVQQGSDRVFVLWTQARTPSGVVIPLDSPGTDALGRSGLTGTVNRHFWQRFGAAMLISVINGGIQYGVQSQNRSGAFVYEPGATQSVMTEALKSTVNIPPTVTVPNGARIQVLVARDIDFRSVYALRPTRK